MPSGRLSTGVSELGALGNRLGRVTRGSMKKSCTTATFNFSVVYVCNPVDTIE